MKITLLVITLLIVSACAALWGPIVSQVEQAKYTVVQTNGAYELRDYAPQLVAETTARGERDAAANEGFRKIADFIFGNNERAQKVAMTAPVLQQSGEKIAMTTPVMQEAVQGEWRIRFVMPSQYTLQTLPKPKNGEVRIIEIPAKRFIALRFSGTTEAEVLKGKLQELENYVAEQSLHTVGMPVYAFYNPPWTLPFLRRNEVMIEIRK